jgi:hypothetical protein
MKANFLGHVGFCFVWLLATMNNVSSSSSYFVVVVVWFEFDFLGGCMVE